MALADTLVDETAGLADEHGWVIEYYSARDYTVDRDDPLAAAHAGLLGVPFVRRERSELDGAVVRIQFVVAEANTSAVIAATPPGLHATSATSPIMPGAAFVTMIRDGVDKGTGIGLITNELGIGTDEVMMVGDGPNDHAALAAVGHPVAMGNAVPEIRELATHVVAPVGDDGVAEALVLSGRLGDN